MKKEEVIEYLYKTFEDYQLSGKIDKCPCGCIPDEDAQKIYSNSLRELTEDDLGFYSGKAMTTWGSVDDYKHFLPRIIELYAFNRYNAWIDLETIYNKLVYGEWAKWPDNERHAILTFVRLNWDEFINQSVNEIGALEFDAYAKYLDFNELLESWKFPENKVALQNFVEYVYLNGNDKIFGTKDVKINRVDRKTDLLNLMCRDKLQDSLEEEFFEVEQVDSEYAGKISVVLQMIENGLKKKDENGR